MSLITDMNEPLATAAGNAVEVQNAVDFLTGKRRDARLLRVTLALGAELLHLAGLASSICGGRDAHAAHAGFGQGGRDRFERMVSTLGGPSDFLARAPELLPRAGVVIEARPERGGIVTGVDVRAVGLAVVALGGGSARAADAIDPSVGLTELAALGHEVGPHRPLAIVHARDAVSAEAVVQRLRQAYRLGDAAPAPVDPIVERIAPKR